VNDRPMLAIAHRAGNNLDALREALDAGVDLVELDVHLFRGALEVRHSQAIGRHLVWEQEHWALNWRRSIVLPELADLLAAAGDDPRLMLDLKGPTLAVAPQVAGLLRTTAPTAEVTVCTKQWRMLDAFTADPHVRLVHSASNRFQLSRLRSRIRRNPGFGVSIQLHILTPEIVAELRESTGEVMVWPVDTQAALDRARWLGATAVISKNLAMLKDLMASR
jgi:glycerophosphoryl diester phosphodiesterase